MDQLIALHNSGIPILEKRIEVNVPNFSNTTINILGHLTLRKEMDLIIKLHEAGVAVNEPCLTASKVTDQLAGTENSYEYSVAGFVAKVSMLKKLSEARISG